MGESDGNLSPLAVTAVRGHEGTVWVLSEQADINFEQRVLNNERTVLSHSAEDGQEAIVARVLCKGADSNSHDSVGRSPLFFATTQGHTMIVNILPLYGADVNQTIKGTVSLGMISGRTNGTVSRR